MGTLPPYRIAVRSAGFVPEASSWLSPSASGVDGVRQVFYRIADAFHCDRQTFRQLRQALVEVTHGQLDALPDPAVNVATLSR